MAITIKIKPIANWIGAETKYPKSSQFRQNYSDTKKILAFELEKLNAVSSSVQIEMFVKPEEIRQDGELRANAKPWKPGVVLSFSIITGRVKKSTDEFINQTKSLSYPCDTFDDWQDNLRAIALSLEALRKVSRYGVFKYEDMVSRLALPSAEGKISSREAAAEFLSRFSVFETSEISENAECAKKAYREAALILHPDNPNFNGNTENFLELQKAKEVLEIR